MTNHAYALHFGIESDQPEVASPGLEVNFLSGDFHSDPSVEVEVGIVGIDDVRIFVSGSWACWGPADQDSDGDNTLHILVHTNRIDTAHVWDLYQALENRLVDGRMIDYAIVSDYDDWSVQTHVATFASNHVAVLETGPSVDNLSIPR